MYNFFIVDQAACPRCSKCVNLYMVVNQVGHSAELLKKVLLRRRNSFLIKRFTSFYTKNLHKSVTVGKVYLSV